MPAHAARRLVSADGGVSTRSLSSTTRKSCAEFHEIALASGACERLTGLAPGACKNLVVVSGNIEVRFASRLVAMAPGDALFFDADAEHIYRNVHAEQPALLHVVTHLPEARPS